MKIQLSDHFTYPRLLRFVLPSILMMIFTSIYSVVDGLFVSNYTGKTPFASLNLIFPVVMIAGALGFVIGTGGTAIVSRTLGMGQKEQANRYFSMLTYVTVIAGIVLSVVCQIILEPIAVLLGATEEMLPYCLIYGRITLLGVPFFMLQYIFQCFFITAEKPKLGLFVTVLAGCANMVLDALFVAVFQWGLAGAAWATATSQVVGGLIPLIYFARKNSSLLHLTRARFEGKILLETCTNGASEFMTNISASIMAVLFNYQLLQEAGENGVAAYGVICYIAFIFAAIFIGFSVGSAPIVGFHYGAGHPDELKNLLRKALTFTTATGICMFVLGIALAGPIAQIFVGYDQELYDMTVHAMRIYSASYLLCGYNIYGSAFFTALGNGAVSAAISFLRTLLFQIICVLILPLIWGIDGIWAAIVVSEGMSLVVTGAFLVKNRSRYHYA